MFRKVLIIVWLLAACAPAYGFALLGPYRPWMAVSNGYAQPGDVGGPMRLGQEYRWNLPVITYGFHPRFVQHFGSNGVRAVEAAVKILNRLPPASQVQLEDFPLRTTLINQDAAEFELRDMKSFVLSQLLHHLGLAPSTPNVWIISGRTNDAIEPGDTFIVAQRNYDPATLALTNAVNGIAYGYLIQELSVGVFDAVEELLDPLSVFEFTTATDPLESSGQFRTGVTRDDVGGLRFLYSPANVNMERLPGSVREAGSGGPPRPNVALRPGVDKVRFAKLPWNPSEGRFSRVTQRFSLDYYDRGALKRQSLQRVVARPDIMFDAKPLPPLSYNFGTNTYYYSKMAEATPATHWLNLSYLGQSAAGPGIITPTSAITIRFDSTRDLPPTPFQWPRWGSFDQSSSPPILFPSHFAED